MFRKLVAFLFSAVLLWAVIYLLRKGTDRYINQAEARYRLKKVVGFVGFIFLVLLALLTFTDKLAYFSVSIGLLTAGVAFALQEVIISIAGWVAILSGNIYKTGDRIEMNEVKGDVIDVGVMKTTIMEIGGWVQSDNYNGRIVQLANSFVFKGKVVNYSGDFPFLWDEINVPIKYGSDYDLVKQILLSKAEEVIGDYVKIASEEWNVMVKKYLIENASVEPSVSLGANDNWLTFNLRYVVDYKKRRVTKSELTRRILAEIAKTNGEVKLASTGFEVVAVPDLNIKLQQEKSE